MGLDHSPIFSTDALAMYLDALNPRSYDGSGSTWYDLSGNGTHGTISSATYSGLGVTKNFYFNGSAQVSLPTGNFSYGTNPRTFIVWCRNTSFNQYGHPFSYGTNANGQATGIAQINYGSAWGTYSSGVEALSGGGSISLETWYHVAVTYDGTTIYVYVNGNVIVGPSTKSYNVVQNSAYVGRYVGTGEAFIGNISQVLFYNRALSAAEILQTYNLTRYRYA